MVVRKLQRPGAVLCRAGINGRAKTEKHRKNIENAQKLGIFFMIFGKYILPDLLTLSRVFLTMRHHSCEGMNKVR